jgi:molecular chaperone HscB
MTNPGFKTAGAAATADYFELFDIEAGYDVDVGALESKYLELSRKVHPDRFVGAAARERLTALQQSMLLNDAYKTLIKPIPRAEYLLVRAGITIAGNEQLDPSFLMEVLELREELQEVVQAGDRARLDQLEEAMLDRRDEALGRVAGHFAELAAGGDREGLLAAVKNDVILLRYINRYIEEFDYLDDEDEL